MTIGVTDERCSGVDRDAVAVSERDVGALTGAIGRSLATPLEARDVIGSFAGLRPLVAGETGSTADLSRRHAVIEDPDSGALTLLGGKLTTYRAMAQDVVDRIAERPGVTAGGCRTASLPLVGAAAPSVLQSINAPSRLIRRYGSEALSVAALASHDPGLLEPVASGVPTLGVELSFGVKHELALTVQDLLDRRTRLGLVSGERDAATEPAQAILAAAERDPSQAVLVAGGQAAW